MSSSVAMSPAITAAGSPGREVQQREDEQRDHRHHGDGREQAFERVAEHAGTRDLRSPGEPGPYHGEMKSPRHAPGRRSGERYFFSTFQMKVTGEMITPERLRAVRGRDDELRGRHVGHRLERALLHVLGDLLLVGHRRRVEPGVAQLLELRVGRPAEPRLLAGAAQRRVQRRRGDVRARRTRCGRCSSRPFRPAPSSARRVISVPQSLAASSTLRPILLQHVLRDAAPASARSAGRWPTSGRSSRPCSRPP